jgi:hypothetical protein
MNIHNDNSIGTDGRVYILNRRGGSNLQDEYSNIGGFTWHRQIKKSISCANTNGAVITEMNILTPLRLFIMTSPKAVSSGNGNRLFIEKRQVQI